MGPAKIVPGPVPATVLTAHNMVCGTPEYMAPEQARGDEIDARCDVYAAGVILYQMLTGVVPFEGPTPLAILTAHLTSTPIPPRERAPGRDISPALEAVVLHAMAKDPADRYANAVDMAAAILHARATPTDLRSVAPEAFRVRVDGDADADGHAPTMPDMTSARPPAIRTPALPTPTPSRSLPAGATPSSLTPPARSGPAPTNSSRPSTRAGQKPEFALGPRGWRIIWIVAALTSICVGVWLSLHVP